MRTFFLASFCQIFSRAIFRKQPLIIFFCCLFQILYGILTASSFLTPPKFEPLCVSAIPDIQLQSDFGLRISLKAPFFYFPPEILSIMQQAWPSFISQISFSHSILSLHFISLTGQLYGIVGHAYQVALLIEAFYLFVGTYSHQSPLVGRHFLPIQQPFYRLL